jgi:hypothetical protein
MTAHPALWQCTAAGKSGALHARGLTDRRGRLLSKLDCQQRARLAQLYQLAHSNGDFQGVLARKSESDQRRPIANRL